MIKKGGNGEVVLTVSGQMDRESVSELKTLIRLEANARQIVLRPSGRRAVCGEDLSLTSPDSKALNRLRGAQLRKFG